MTNDIGKGYMFKNQSDDSDLEVYVLTSIQTHVLYHKKEMHLIVIVILIYVQTMVIINISWFFRLYFIHTFLFPTFKTQK